MPKPSLTPAAPRPPQAPAAPKGLGRRVAWGKAVATKTIRQLGPRWLHLGTYATLQPDWCVAPPDFVGAHTSTPEFMIYAAISKVTHDPPDPRKPPYVGGITWQYQDPLLGGRQTKGGQVCDFAIQWGGETVCIRLQSEYFHVEGSASKKASELFDKSHDTFRVEDIYEGDFVADCTLRAACAVVANALAGRDTPDPANLGTAQQVRRKGGSKPVGRSPKAPG